MGGCIFDSDRILLTAALIVKNEEKFLAPCLLSLKNIADEIVVVDTGSTDRTKSIAAEHGAKLYDFKWRNDFAAARNFALDQAQGEWILYIDADERVRQIDAGKLRDKLKNPTLTACYVQLHPRPESTAYPEMRIFRNDPLIRFQGCIHENIWPGIQRYRSLNGGRIGTSGLVLDHEGYEGDQNHKHRRNRPLLRRALQEDPNRVFCWCHLANIYMALGKDRQAKKAWKRAISVVRKKNRLISEDSLPYTGLIGLKMKQEQRIAPLFDQAVRLFPGNLQLHWLRATDFMNRGCWAEAIEVFTHIRRCVETGDYDRAIAYDRRLLTTLPASCVATCYFKLENYAESARWFKLAEQLDPDNLEYRVKRELCAMLERSNSSEAKQSEIIESTD